MLNSGQPHDLGNTADSDNRAFVANLAKILILMPSLNLVIGQTHESDYRAIYLILAIGQIAILTLFESGSESKSGSLGLANPTCHPPHNRMQAADLNLTLKL